MKKKSAKEVYTFADLQNWRDTVRDVHPPIRLAVLGDPVVHSLSPQIQNAALRDCKIDVQYVRLQISAEQLSASFRLLRDLHFTGWNLTLPHKVHALDFVDEVDDEAKRIGAINTVAVRSGKFVGFNTDGKGFSRAIREEFSVDLRDLRVLILGAGGAARAIAVQCGKENCERLVVANRTADKAQKLVEQLRDFFVGPKVFGPVPRLQAVSWDDASIRFQVANVDLIVNATPVGLKRGDSSPIPARLLAPHLMVYDTVYEKEQSGTPFVSAALEAGARAANGLSMLLHQGARAFEIWFGRSAALDAMRATLTA
jgi:shikimate dehydrogenase